VRTLGLQAGSRGLPLLRHSVHLTLAAWLVCHLEQELVPRCRSFPERFSAQAQELERRAWTPDG